MRCASKRFDWIGSPPSIPIANGFGPWFWADPVDALSNLSFLAAALWAAVEARKRGADRVIWGLIAMAARIGVASFLFHTFAKTWSEYADTIPIWSFVAAFVLVSMHRVGGVMVTLLLQMLLRAASLPPVRA